MQAQSIAQYSCVSLPGLNKVGLMKPDANGYYRTVVGGFNLSNHVGKMYLLTDSVKRMFEPGGIVRRRLDAGLLRGELGHPDIRAMPLTQALQRLAQIDPARVSHHFKSLELVAKKDHKGRDVVLVYAMVKPSGPYGPSLLASLDNPEENVTFSVRSFSKNGVDRGRMGTIVTDVLTYDYVTEPGISVASQFDMVSLENLSFTTNDLSKAISNQGLNGSSVEGDSISTLTMIRDNLGWNKVEILNLSSLDL